LEEQDKTNIMNLIEKIFSTDNPQVRVFYSIVHNKLTSLNYLDTNQSPNLLLVEQSLQMKKLDPNFVIPKSTKDALSKDRKNNEFKKVNEKLKEQGFDWSNDLDKSLYYKYVTKTWTQTQELPLNADQKEESQTLISNKDFSGINKKLTNWFIE
jgi:poly-D-alanine transfer protein DltD